MSKRINLRDANNAFCGDLYQHGLLSNTKWQFKKKNLVFSPYSLHSILGMITLGAEEETREELLDGLNFNGDEDNATLGETYQLVAKSFQEKGSCTVSSANRIYCRTGFKLNHDFVNLLNENFFAGIEQVDFSTEEKREETAKKINEWISSSTEEKIDNVIDPYSLEDTCLLLVNAMYFKGKWEKSFPKDNSRSRYFRLGSNSKSKRIQVDSMAIVDELNYAEIKELDATACAIPYEGGRLALVIILPNDVNGLGKLQRSIQNILAKDQKFTIRNKFKSQKVSLQVPKFKIETTLDELKNSLEILGMETMFSNTDANFEGIILENSDQVVPYVAKVIQKVYIEMDEEGTEAAAASDIKKHRMTKSQVREPRTREKIRYFTVDHPFYYQIVDQSNGDLILFAGHCIDPRATSTSS